MTEAMLHLSIQSLIASKRIGVPVFVRLILQGDDDDINLLRKLSVLTHLAQSWLGQTPRRLQAMGSLVSGQVSLSILYPNGATACIAYARGAVLGDGLDLLLLGNHGAVYHDAGSARLLDTPIPITSGSQPPLTEQELRRALESGEPISLGSGAQP